MSGLTPFNKAKDRGVTNIGSGTGDHLSGEHPYEDASGDVRIGDAERQAVVDMLSRQAAAGRLTLDEFAERAGLVFAARTRTDLVHVLADLPPDLPVDATPRVSEAAGLSGSDTTGAEQGPTFGPGTPAAGWTPADAPDRPSRRQRRKRRFVAVMSGASARGRWWAPRKIRAFAWWGGVKIDLREAIISSPEIHIKASAYMGHVLVVVPDGIPVDMYGFVLMGGSTNRASGSGFIQGAPLVRVKARGLWGGVTVRSGKQHAEARQRADRHAAERERVRAQLRDHGCMSNRRQRETAGYDTSAPGSDAADANAAQQPDEGRNPPWVAGELPTPSLQDALPLLDDLPGFAHAKSKLRDRLLAAAELFEADAGPPSKPGAAPPPRPADPPRDTPRDSETPADPDSTSRLPLGTMTILVTDIVGSTRMAGILGDQRWMEVLRHHNELVREQVATNDGTEVKAQGDGFMIVFPSARKAILAAVDIQRAMAKYRAEHPDHEIELRTGLHTGEVVTDDNDIHGQNVVTAVRIADAAAPNEILVSGITRDLTASAGDLQFDDGRHVPLKGFTEDHRVHQVSWI